ncbi:MAG: hypothetical protein KKD01_00470 [Proteobacteria bacterium]|nr:hypothetical protein [Pseudomonadota bacterium]MBU1453171.1 hypothetical protein [Pseudomonadota bacterium]
MQRLTGKSPSLKNRALMYIVLVSSMTGLGAAAVLAQMPAFAYKGDSERIPAEISLDFRAGKYEIIKSEYLSLKDKQSGSLVDMEGFNTTNSPGDPLLPARIYEIALPPNIDWETLQLSVDSMEKKILPGNYDMLPAPPERARVEEEELVDWGEGKDIVAGRNMNVYGRDSYFPEEPVRIVSYSQLRKWRFLRLEFSPVHYNPAKQSLRVIRSIKIRLSFMRIGKKVFRNDPLLADTVMDEEARKRFVNFKEAQEWYRYVPQPGSDATVADPDYIILTTNAIRDNSTKLADLVLHKTALGHSLQIVTEDDYGMVGNAEAIRQWLITNYVPLGIHYLLLIGDPDPDDPDNPSDSVGNVPMLMTWPRRSAYNYKESVTDYFYADLTGDWDLDGDGRYGEYESVTNPTSPDPTVDPDSFSVRWTGKIEADSDGSYTFAAVSDNGIRLVIDGVTVIDNWTSHTVTTNYISATLTTGLHDIQVEYYDDSGDAVATILWRPPGQDYIGTIPNSKLYHLLGDSYVSGGLDAEYFNNTDFTASALNRVDNTINFVWSTGDRGPGGVDFDPELFVGRIPVYGTDYAALDTILQKLIDYETVPPPAWRRSLLSANVELWPDQSDYQLGEALKAYSDPLGYTSYRIYESDFGIVPAPECPAINTKGTDPAAPCNMLGEWSNSGGYGLMTWSTHGGSSSASHLLTSADTTHLNDGTPAFTFQGSCLNGYPEVSDNLGYALLQQGAAGTVSASRVSWNSVFNPIWDPNPQSGTNANLTYHYTTRMMQDQATAHALYLTKSNVNPDSSWMNKMDYNLYGDPSSALIRSVGGMELLFDTSGSMSWSHEGVSGVPVAEQRLSLAKEAVYPFMELLNDHANSRVNFGISVFPPHPWDYAVGCNGQVITPMTLADDTTTTTAVTATIPGLVAAGNTPLLAGLNSALGTFSTETPRTLVLLSDGYHNCPVISGPFDPTVDTLLSNLNAASTRVYTIGFGRPTDIDHPLLARLATDSGGEFYDVTTPAFDPATWSPATDLQATYKAILVDALGLETAADPMGLLEAGKSVSHEVKINEHDRRVSVFLSWQTPQENRLALRVKTSDGLPIPLTTATPGVIFHQGKTHTTVTLHHEFLQNAGKVGPTPWLLEIDAGPLDQGEREYYQYSVIVDSGLAMDVTLDKEKYWVGDTIVLQARLTADRQPITGLANVRVQVSAPEDGFGNWFALNKVSTEELEKIPSEREGEILSQMQRKAIYLSDVRKIGAPGRLTAYEIQLYDDGTHGDALAGDGAYTNAIAQTGKEGTYAFHVRAEGPTSGGNGFDRDVALHKYLTPRVSARHITLTVMQITSDDPKLTRYELTMTLLDALGNHLGPRYAGAIKLTTEPELNLAPVKDHLDGTYSQVLELPANIKMEDVKISLTAQDAELSFSLADKVEKHVIPDMTFWLVLLILTTFIFAVFLIRRHGNRS